MDKLSQLEAFVGVADRGSFRAAAESLGLTPSAVSKQVQALEDRLGVRLLNRTTRRVSLTEVGRDFLDRTRDALHSLDEAEERALRLQSEPRGVLRFSAPMDFGRDHLAAPLAHFAARHPSLELEADFTDRFVDLVEEGFDVVIRIGAAPDSSLISRRLAPCRRVICAAPAYLDAHGTPATPRDLAASTRIGYRFETTTRWRFGNTTVAVPVRQRANNGALVRELVAAGLGLALLPTFLVADDLRAGRLVSLFDRELDEDISIHALFPHRRQLSEKVRRFVDFLTTHCGPRPYWDEGLELTRGSRSE